MTFRNISVICEGTTESDFIKHLSRVYFVPKHICLKPIIMDGNVSIDRLVYFVHRANYPISTTFVDYYGIKGNHKESCEELEALLKEKVKKEHFIPYLQKHETEALWFSNIDVLSKVKNATVAQQKKLQTIITNYPNPENINNSRETAPSKRLMSIFSNYNKIIDGNSIAQNISIEEIKSKCPRFANWLSRIEQEVY